VLKKELVVWAGDVAEDSNDVRECARAGPRRARGRRSSQEGPTTQRERKRARGATVRCLAMRARKAEREEGRTGEGNQRRQLGPTRQRKGESERTGEKTAADGWRPPIRRGGRVAPLG
jgi:hypothetical protein